MDFFDLYADRINGCSGELSGCRLLRGFESDADTRAALLTEPAGTFLVKFAEPAMSSAEDLLLIIVRAVLSKERTRNGWRSADVICSDGSDGAGVCECDG